MKKLQTTVEVANLLHVAEHRINYAMRVGRIPQPKMRMAGRKVFTKNEIKRIAAYFQIQLQEGGDLV